MQEHEENPVHYPDWAPRPSAKLEAEKIGGVQLFPDVAVDRW